MIAVKAYVYNALSTDAALLAALGPGKVLYMYPNDFNALPVVTYLETDQFSSEHFDDSPFSYTSKIQIDLWTHESTTALSELVDTVMRRLQFNLDSGNDVPDPDTRIFHRILRYSRKMRTDEIDAT